MKTAVVYKTESDHARAVSDFLRDFQRQTGKSVEEIDPDTRDGSAFCQAHDIVEYPTTIAFSDNGLQLQVWRGLPLPTISEVSHYVE